MSSEGPYGRQGFQSNPAGYGGGDGANSSYMQPQYGGGGGYGGGSYSAPNPTYGGGVDYNPYGASVGGEYEVRKGNPNRSLERSIVELLEQAKSAGRRTRGRSQRLLLWSEGWTSV
jgi:hypothetical protein